MEEKKAMNEELYKSRSYLGCLSEGLKFPTRHIMDILKFVYPSLLVCAVVVGLWGAFNNQMSVMMAGWLSAEEPVMLSFPAYSLGLLTLLWIIADSFYMGNLMTGISRFASTGQWQPLRFSQVWREVAFTSLRSLSMNLLFYVFLSVVMGVLALCIGLEHILWLVLIFYVLLFALGIPYTMVWMDYLLGGHHNMLRSFAYIKEGFRYFGAIFIILFCGGLIVGLLAGIAWMPASILSFAGHESMMGALNGDVTDLPAMIPTLTVFFFILGGFITYLFYNLILFPLSYLYGSIEARKKEKARFEEEEQRIQGL